MPPGVSRLGLEPTSIGTRFISRSTKCDGFLVTCVLVFSLIVLVDVFHTLKRNWNQRSFLWYRSAVINKYWFHPILTRLHLSFVLWTHLCLFYSMSASAGENNPIQGENVPVCMSAHPLVENVPFRVKMPQFSLEWVSVSKADRSGSECQCGA